MNVRKVLIADDDENDRFLIKWAFDKAGFGELIVFARDGAEAIDILKERFAAGVQVDARLLLLDIRMPGMDGFQVLEWLQRNPYSRPPMVVILSSSSDLGDIERAMALGANDYKVKPYGLQAYRKLIQEFEFHTIDSWGSAKRETSSAQ